MNPDSDFYYTYTSGPVYSEAEKRLMAQIARQAQAYHSNPQVVLDIKDTPDRKKQAEVRIERETNNPADLVDTFRAVDFSKYSVEDLEQVIDFLGERIMEKRGESLLDQDPHLSN